MCQPLPVGDYRWMTASELQQTDYTAYSDDDEWGFILEVDLAVPEHLHDYFNGFPPCPERLTITGDKASIHMQRCMQHLGIDQESFRRKTITATLAPKIRYRIHNRLLSLYLKLGLRITKVHRGVRFRVGKFLSEYMNKLANIRRNATSNFRKNIAKTQIVSTYGKMLVRASTKKISFFLICPFLGRRAQVQNRENGGIRR